jgi:two-component system sensor histidine kinase KdpD
VRRLSTVARTAISLGTIAVVTALLNQGIAPQQRELLQTNPTTVALTYLVVILVIATGWGIAEATAASVLAVICFNFFFLPPVGTFTIADPQNWVAFVAFLITAIVTSQLSGRARQRTLEAVERQRDLERMYAFSRSLLLVDAKEPVASAIARHIADVFQVPAAGIYDQEDDAVRWAGTRELPSLDATLRDVVRRGTVEQQGDALVMPIQLGGVTIGSMAIAGTRLSDTVLHSVANLVAIGIERTRSQEAATRAQAAQSSGELRAAVLDALAHEFKTPLTSLKAAASALVASGRLDRSDRELAAIVDEDASRLEDLISDAVQMLRIDAGQFALHPQRLRVADLTSNVLRQFDRRLDGHTVTSNVPDGLTVDADRDLLGLAIRQLLDNAIKYSPPSSSIDVAARGNGSVDLTIRNSGSVIPAGEHQRVFERFYRGSTARLTSGTGMGLAIARQIAQAHHGSLSVTSSAAAGTTFTLSLPRQAVRA